MSPASAMIRSARLWLKPRRPRRQPGRADQDLGGVDPAGEVEHGLGGVVAGDGVELAAQFLGEPAQFGELAERRGGQAVGPGDVHRQQLPAGQPGGDPGTAAQQGLALRPAGQGDHHAFPRGPVLGDAVLGPVALQPGVDLVGQPEQRQFAQRPQVAHPEVVGQGGVHLLGTVDVAVRHPAAQRLGRHVHQLDLLGRAHHLVRHRLALHDAGDGGHHVVQRLQVLDVHRRDHVDAGVQQFVDVLPALLVAGARDVGVGQFVDQRDLRVPGEDRVEVHLLQRRALVVEPPAGDDLEAVLQCGGMPATVGLAQADHHIGAAAGPAVALVEHGDGLAHPGRRPEIDPQPASSHGYILTARTGPG